MVDDAREVTIDQAKAYQTTGKKVKPPKPSTRKVEVKKVGKVLEELPAKQNRLYIRLPDTSDSKKLETLKAEIDKSPGDTEVVLVIGEDSNKQLVKLPTRVEPNELLLVGLSEIFGKEQVKLS